MPLCLQSWPFKCRKASYINQVKLLEKIIKIWGLPEVFYWCYIINERSLTRRKFFKVHFAYFFHPSMHKIHKLNECQWPVTVWDINSRLSTIVCMQIKMIEVIITWAKKNMNWYDWWKWVGLFFSFAWKVNDVIFEFWGWINIWV